MSDRTATRTFAELAVAAEALGRRLAARGVGPGDRVGVLVERGVDLVVALLGVSAAGAAYLPLDPGYPGDRLRGIVQDAEPSYLITDGIGPRFDVPALHVVSGPAEPDLAATALPTPSSQDPAYMIYTSGSTGRPKGVVVTNANLAALFDALDAAYGSPLDDTFLVVTSVSFEFVGRSDRQVKISGVRIELDEIESVLSALPDVRAAAVVAARGRTGSTTSSPT